MRKKVLLTGGSRGIGKAILKELENEYEVIAPSSKILNLLDINSIESYFKNNSMCFDILINNAGINIIKPIDSILNEDIEKIMTINLTAPLKLIQNVSQNMKSNKFGKIVNISSIWGIHSKENRTLYSSTKFGIIGQTKALSRELGKYNILVNAVCPGFTATDLTMDSLCQDEIKFLEHEIPLQRLAQPKEIAKTVKFLIGDDNTYITGQTIIIDGGFTA